MSVPLVTCTKCTAPLPGEAFNTHGFFLCPGCGRKLQVEMFPAIFQRFTPGRTGETIMEEGESSCFYHPQKKAVVPCDACGRFLCALCDCELDGRHICPACLEAGKTKGKIKNLQNRRMRYDQIVLALSIVPLGFLVFITAPMAIFLSIRHWNTPCSLTVRYPKVRYAFAIAIASLQILLWVAVFGSVFSHHSTSR